MGMIGGVAAQGIECDGVEVVAGATLEAFTERPCCGLGNGEFCVGEQIEKNPNLDVYVAGTDLRQTVSHGASRIS